MEDNLDHKSAGVGQKWYLRSRYLLAMLIIFLVVSAGFTNVFEAVSAVFAVLAGLVLFAFVWKGFVWAYNSSVETASRREELAKSGYNSTDIQRKSTSWSLVVLLLILGVAPLPAFLNSLKPDQRNSSIVFYVLSGLFFYALAVFVSWKKRQKSMVRVMSRQSRLAPYLLLLGFSVASVEGIFLNHTNFTLPSVVVCLLLGFFAASAAWVITLKLFPHLLSTPAKTKL